MKDVEKIDVERDDSKKRIRRRKRKMNLYGLIVILIVIAAGITMCYTFLFNINEIRVSGESDQYSAEDIVAASGINKGDNLFRLDSQECERNILDNLIYIETADVDRDFPSSINITVSKCIPAYNVVYDNSCLLVSQKGKILSDNAFITEGLTIIYGTDPADPTPGKMFQSSDEQKNDAFYELIQTLEDTPTIKIESLDMTDKYSLLSNLNNSIIFKMGNWTDIRYKLNMATDVMQDENVTGKTGYITMIGNNQCSFRSSDQPAYVPGASQPAVTGTSPALTEPNGLPIMTTGIQTTTTTLVITRTQEEENPVIYNEEDYYYDDNGWEDDGNWEDDGYYEDDWDNENYYEDDYNEDDNYEYFTHLYKCEEIKKCRQET